jgi:hypothetical protein
MSTCGGTCGSCGCGETRFPEWTAEARQTERKVYRVQDADLEWKDLGFGMVGVQFTDAFLHGKSFAGDLFGQGESDSAALEELFVLTQQHNLEFYRVNIGFRKA